MCSARRFQQAPIGLLARRETKKYFGAPDRSVKILLDAPPELPVDEDPVFLQHQEVPETVHHREAGVRSPWKTARHLGFTTKRGAASGGSPSVWAAREH
jgi:hypothetical protein